MFLAGILTTDGVIDGALAARTPRIVPDGRTFSYVLHDGEPRLVITQNDVRQIQLAKAALYAGCRLLMDTLGIETVDRIRLAGAFGAHIDPVHALVLGLVPDCDPVERDVRRQRGRDRRADRAVEPRGPRARSRTSSAAWRRSRPRSSRGSRSTSSARWASRTRRIRRRGWRRSFRCPPRGARAERPATSAAAAAGPERPRPARPRGAPHERDRESDADAPRRRTGGRAGRQAARAASAPERVPYITRTLPPFEVLTEEGLEIDRAQRRHDPGAGGHRLPRRARRPRAVQGRPVPTWTAIGCGSRAGCAAS